MAVGKAPEKGRESGQSRPPGQPKSPKRLLNRLSMFFLILAAGFVGHYVPMMWSRFEEPLEPIRFVSSLPRLADNLALGFSKVNGGTPTKFLLDMEDADQDVDEKESSELGEEAATDDPGAAALASSEPVLESSRIEDPGSQPVVPGRDGRETVQPREDNQVPPPGPTGDQELPSSSFTETAAAGAAMQGSAARMNTSQPLTAPAGLPGRPSAQHWRTEAHKRRLAARKLNGKQGKANRQSSVGKSLEALLTTSRGAAEALSTSQGKTAGSSPAEGAEWQAALDRETNWIEPNVTNKTWRTRYVVDVKISVARTRWCKEFYPLHLINGSNLDRRPITRVHHLRRPGTRALVFLPRFGLGNSLRGYVSSFIYAMLTGRRLVRFHGGPYSQVFDALCTAFRCGFDAIHWEDYGDQHRLLKELEKMKPFLMASKLRSSAILKSLSSRRPVVVTKLPNFVDGYWINDRRFSKCVFAAFKCRGGKAVRCVYSRALRALLKGGPSEALDATVSEILERRFPPRMVPQVVQNGPMGVDVEFDLSIHLRTRTLRVESLSDMAKCQHAKCRELFEQKIEDNNRKYTTKNLWNCIGLSIHALEKFLPSRNRSLENGGLSIFLATDNEQLRPVFVQNLQQYGTVYYSAGKVVHTSKSKGSTSRLPTMAEFYLMSKAHVLLESEDYVSTFAYFASMNGNGTLAALAGGRSAGCKLRIDHKGRRVQ